ncbi:hypothetical protein AAAC51_07225 [Priestia megaterium]
MTALDKIIKRNRKARYKRLKKLFKARDMVSKYAKKVIKVSEVDDFLDAYEHELYTTGMLAKQILDYSQSTLTLIRRPSKPSVATLKKRK